MFIAATEYGKDLGSYVDEVLDEVLPEFSGTTDKPIEVQIALLRRDIRRHITEYADFATAKTAQAAEEELSKRAAGRGTAIMVPGAAQVSAYSLFPPKQEEKPEAPQEKEGFHLFGRSTRALKRALRDAQQTLEAIQQQASQPRHLVASQWSVPIKGYSPHFLEIGPNRPLEEILYKAPSAAEAATGAQKGPSETVKISMMGDPHKKTTPKTEASSLYDILLEKAVTARAEGRKTGIWLLDQEIAWAAERRGFDYYLTPEEGKAGDLVKNFDALVTRILHKVEWANLYNNKRAQAQLTSAPGLGSSVTAPAASSPGEDDFGLDERPSLPPAESEAATVQMPSSREERAADQKYIPIASPTKEELLRARKVAATKAHILVGNKAVYDKYLEDKVKPEIIEHTYKHAVGLFRKIYAPVDVLTEQFKDVRNFDASSLERLLPGFEKYREERFASNTDTSKMAEAFNTWQEGVKKDILSTRVQGYNGSPEHVKAALENIYFSALVEAQGETDAELAKLVKLRNEHGTLTTKKPEDFIDDSKRDDRLGELKTEISGQEQKLKTLYEAVHGKAIKEAEILLGAEAASTLKTRNPINDYLRQHNPARSLLVEFSLLFRQIQLAQGPGQMIIATDSEDNSEQLDYLQSLVPQGGYITDDVFAKMRSDARAGYQGSYNETPGIKTVFDHLEQAVDRYLTTGKITADDATKTKKRLAQEKLAQIIVYNTLTELDQQLEEEGGRGHRKPSPQELSSTLNLAYNRFHCLIPGFKSAVEKEYGGQGGRSVIEGDYQMAGSGPQLSEEQVHQLEARFAVAPGPIIDEHYIGLQAARDRAKVVSELQKTWHGKLRLKVGLG